MLSTTTTTECNCSRAARWNANSSPYNGFKCPLYALLIATWNSKTLSNAGKLNATVALAVTTTCLFGGLYIRENLGTTILFIFFSAGQLGLTIYQARTWVRLAAQVASDLEFKNHLSSIVFKIDIFMAAQTVILGGLIAICALGVHISQDLSTQLSTLWSLNLLS